LSRDSNTSKVGWEWLNITNRKPRRNQMKRGRTPNEQQIGEFK